ncbi:MAG TPA: hypothetical protein ENK89_05765 [Desulfobulbaceae bacterium]|nr:hypothetical protein [Desulfobulbaceae bacterium]
MKHRKWILPALMFILFLLHGPANGHAQHYQQVSVGDDHTVVIKADGSLWSWGRNILGQLGDGTNRDRNVPVRIEAGHAWKSVAAGGRHTLAITDDGRL